MADKRASEILKGARGEAARAKSSADLEQVRVKYLGRQGILTQFLRSLSSIPAAERPEVGREANLAKAEIETLLGER
ncbi:MAG: phenylalanine--tRNA ligase subunit alpha, partial [Candidatus Rokuibacteriota bacterium]